MAVHLRMHSVTDNLTTMKRSEIYKIKRLIRELHEERKQRMIWILSNQMCIVGDNDIQIMKQYLRLYEGKEVTDIYPVNRNHNSIPNGIYSLTKIIELGEVNPAEN